MEEGVRADESNSSVLRPFRLSLEDPDFLDKKMKEYEGRETFLLQELRRSMFVFSLDDETPKNHPHRYGSQMVGSITPQFHHRMSPMMRVMK